jgi:hypothetical protein
MKSSIRGVILGSVGWALVGLAGCGDENVKNAGEDFKNTTTAPPTTKAPTNADIAKQYTGGTKAYPNATRTTKTK